MRSGTVVTFYSYKGGTGRSMSLANVAWILASNGLRVLVVDWDLEAPGLHRYFHPFLPDGTLRSSPGVIDMMWEFANAAMDPMASDGPDWHVRYARTSPYVMSVEHGFRGGGAIDLMPAGRQDDSYSALVSTFDWDNFYDRLGGGGFLEALKRDMRERYDYVLVDSRTGLSDTAGVCTVALPDTVVTCFSMSTQSIDGAAAVAASIARQRLDELRILPVPMRVENGEHDKLETSRDYARQAFDAFLWHVDDVDRYWGQVEVPYRSYYAYEEILATIGDRPQQENTILAAAERLVDHLTRGEVSSLVAAGSEGKRRELLALFLRAKTPRPRPEQADLPDFKVCLTSADTAGARSRARELRYLLRQQGFDVDVDLGLHRWTTERERAKLVVLETAEEVRSSYTWIEWDSGSVIRVRSDDLDKLSGQLVDQLTRPAPARVPPLSVGEWSWGRDAISTLRVQATEDLALRVSDVEAHDTSRLPVEWSAEGLTGSVRTLSDVFLTTPFRKLIILGEPGSGKSVTALLLARGLLAHENGPIPILMPTGTWRPATEFFDDWVVRTIVANNPSLRPSKDLVGDLTRLVRLGAVVPVIDGHDDLTFPEKEQAWRQIADTTTPVIATWRTDEYLKAVTDYRPSRTSVVELLPVDLDEALRYLSSNTARLDHRTDEVLSALSRRPDAPLARVLASPAMIGLARSYLDNARADLGTLAAMTSVDEVSAALTDNYLRESLDPRGHRPGEPDYGSWRTRRWLTLIATRPESTLRWWQLHKALPPRFERLLLWLLGLVLTLPLGLVILLQLNGPGLIIGLLSTSLALISAAALTPAPEVPAVWPITGYLSPASRRHRHQSDKRITQTPRSERNDSLFFIGASVVAGVVLIFVLAWISGEFSSGTVPPQSYHEVTVAAAGAWFGGSAGLAMAMTTAWSRYLVSRLALAYIGRLPWRLNRFLEDANRQGILRRIGTVYEFRDKRLADALAGRCRIGGTDVPSTGL